MTNIPLLVGVSGKASGQRYQVPPHGLRIGRQAGNEVILDENGVSRQHARLIFHNGALWVQDMGSRNGVFVNDARVQAHRQLSIGDRVRVGASVFEVLIEEPSSEQSVSVAAPALGAPRRGFRLLPFAVATIAIVALVAAVAWAGRGRVKIAAPREDDVEIASLLGASVGTGAAPAGAATQPSGGPAPVVDASLSALLDGAPTSGGAIPPVLQPDIQETWPDPPPGMTSRELVEKAHSLYNSGHLHDALVCYHQAQALDPACEICARRIDRLNSEIATKISEHFDAGLRYYDDMQFQQAIASWEMVLLLSPNPQSRSYQQAKEYLAKAQSQVASQY